MKTTLAASLSLALFFTSTPLAQRRAILVAQSKRVALVIGNSAYKTSPLSNPVNDARDMARSLREMGFEVVSKENATRAQMKSSIQQFGNNIIKGDVALFYYAGHGAQVKGENYLIPVDAAITKEEEIEYESVNAGFVMAQMASAQNKLNIVILDACRNNPFARSFRSQASGLAQMTAPAGTIVAYATEPGSVAADGAGKNGLYTGELLKAMSVPGLKIEELFKQVRIAVRNKSQNKQTPWESSSLEGDFYFIQPVSNNASVAQNAAAPVAPVTVDSSVIELKFWESIEKSNNPEDFEAYINQYPNGTFVSLARIRIKTLEADKVSATSNPGATSSTASNPTGAPNATGSADRPGVAPNASIPYKPSKSEPDPWVSFKLLHDVYGEADHRGALSISPDAIQWAEENGNGSQGDTITNLTCAGLGSVQVVLGAYPAHVGHTSAIPLEKVELKDREYITIKIKDKSINQRGSDTYTFLTRSKSDDRTIRKVGEAIKRNCPDVNVKTSKH